MLRILLLNSLEFGVLGFINRKARTNGNESNMGIGISRWKPLLLKPLKHIRGYYQRSISFLYQGLSIYRNWLSRDLTCLVNHESFAIPKQIPSALSFQSPPTPSFSTTPFIVTLTGFDVIITFPKLSLSQSWYALIPFFNSTTRALLWSCNSKRSKPSVSFNRQIW